MWHLACHVSQLRDARPPLRHGVELAANVADKADPVIFMPVEVVRQNAHRPGRARLRCYTPPPVSTRPSDIERT
jgi:hypothetical protein